MSTSQPAAGPDGEDLRSLARSMRLLFEFSARTLEDMLSLITLPAHFGGIRPCSAGAGQRVFR